MEFLANPIRLRVITELVKSGDLSAGEIALRADLDAEIVTLHLHFMEEKGFVEHHFGEPCPDDPRSIEPCFRLTPVAKALIGELELKVA